MEMTIGIALAIFTFGIATGKLVQKIITFIENQQKK